MKTIEIIHKAQSLESKDIFLLLAKRHIGVHFNLSEADFEKGQKALIIGDRQGNTGIFVNPSVKPKDVEFLLWHEFGHYETEDSPTLQRNFMFSSDRTRHEYEANMFAVFALIPEFPVQPTIFHAAKAVGIPYDILNDVLFKISEDPDSYVRNYFSLYYL